MKHYQDNFAHNSLPNNSLQPNYLKGVYESEMLNCVERLLDYHIKNDNGNNICIRTFTETWTYNDLYEKANQMCEYKLNFRDLL